MTIDIAAKAKALVDTVLAEPANDHDIDLVQRQLGRYPRGMVAVGARCVCGRPLAVITRPVLPGGIPFPTTNWQDVLATVRSILKALRPAACRCASSACMPCWPNPWLWDRASTPLAIWYWNASKTNSIRPSAAARWTIDQQMSQREQSIHTH